MTRVTITRQQQIQAFTNEVARLAIRSACAINQQLGKLVCYCRAYFSGQLANMDGCFHLSHRLHWLALGQLLVKGLEFFTKGEGWLSTVTVYQAADSRLRCPALLANFSLSQVAVVLNFGNDLFPHTAIITQLRFKKADLRYLFPVPFNHGN